MTIAARESVLAGSVRARRGLPIQLMDASALARVGVKGPRAEAWLAARGLTLPVEPNRWQSSDGLTLARLGRSEFFVEAEAAHSGMQALAAALELPPEDGVYPVLRADAAIALGGERALVRDVLAELSSYDFEQAGAGQVVLTQLAGISVMTYWHEPGESEQAVGRGRVYRVYCDPSFGPHLWASFQSLVAAVGGGEASLEALSMAAPAPARASAEAGMGV